MYGSRRALVSLLLLAAVVRPGAALAGDDGPSNKELVIVGSLMAVPTYFIGVTLHEGSHALVAKAAGATITEFRVWPAVDEVSGHFYFGLTRYRGRLTTGEKTLFFLAPKITDLVLLAGYSALVELDALPSNEYGTLALTVFATGSWVDFTKDVFSFSSGNDMVKLYSLHGRDSEWQRLPFRLLHAGVSATAAYFVVKGYLDLFDRDDPAAAAPAAIFQLYSTRF